MTTPKAPPAQDSKVVSVGSSARDVPANDPVHVATPASRAASDTAGFGWKLTTRNRAHHVCRALLDADAIALGEIVKAGAPGDALVWMARATDLSFARCTSYLGISRATAIRKLKPRDDVRFGPADSDAVVAFGRLIGQAQLLAGRSQLQLESAAAQLGTWLEATHPELRAAPASILHFGIGRAEVLLLLKIDISRGRF